MSANFFVPSNSTTNMPSNMPNSAVQQEGRILLAIDVLNKN